MPLVALRTRLRRYPFGKHCILYLIVLFMVVGQPDQSYLAVRQYWMIYRGPGFLRSYNSAPRPPPSSPLLSATCLYFSVFLCVAGRAYSEGRGGKGWSWSRITQPKESLALCKSFNTFCFLYKLVLWARICKCLRSPGIDSAGLCSLAGLYDK